MYHHSSIAIFCGPRAAGATLRLNCLKASLLGSAVPQSSSMLQAFEANEVLLRLAKNAEKYQGQLRDRRELNTLMAAFYNHERDAIERVKHLLEVLHALLGARHTNASSFRQRTIAAITKRLSTHCPPNETYTLGTYSSVSVLRQVQACRAGTLDSAVMHLS